MLHLGGKKINNNNKTKQKKTKPTAKNFHGEGGEKGKGERAEK